MIFTIFLHSKRYYSFKDDIPPRTVKTTIQLTEAIRHIIKGKFPYLSK